MAGTDLVKGYMCRFCGRSLERHYDVRQDGSHGPISYRHNTFLPGTPEHDPVPVPIHDYADQVSVCDFCGSPEPSWDFPAEDFDISVPEDERGVPTTYHSIKNWYACDGCAHDIEVEDYDEIFARWLRGHPRIIDPATRRSVRRKVKTVHQDFQRHRDGPPVRIT